MSFKYKPCRLWLFKLSLQMEFLELFNSKKVI